MPPVDEINPVQQALEAERLGFDFVSVADHPFGVSPTNEPLVTLAVIGAATSRIGLVTRVLGLPFRNPALVAKMAETLDRLTDGRLVLGLGGGGADDKMLSVGIDPPSAREKLDGLADAVAIITGLWSEDRYTFHGKRYAVAGAALNPKPRGRIPLWLGVLGPRGADLAGETADGWIPYRRYTSPDRLRVCRRRLATAAEKAGRDPAAITCVVSVEAHVGELPDAPSGAFTGPPEQVAEELADLLAIGFDGVNVTAIGPDRIEQPERFAEEVLPMLDPDRTPTAAAAAGTASGGRS
jgi:alkanesulfonate monooxygenase SsuD/methylene tetrahydromethanopterin reductase-like flavin-dependent oxidoreductase (luciferase family)